MASNVYTKNEILQNLSSRGFFIDAYTLDTFLEKWKIEAIFEDEQGTEFFDKNTLDLVLEKMFNASGSDTNNIQQEEVRTLSSKSQVGFEPVPSIQVQPQVQIPPYQQQYNQPQQQYNQQYQQQYNQPHAPQAPQMPYQQQYNQPQYNQQQQQYQQQYNQQYQQQYNQPHAPQAPQMPYQQQYNQPQYNQPQQQAPQAPYQNNTQTNIQPKKEKIKIDDYETAELLNNISLSDGSALIDNIQNSNTDFDIDVKPQDNDMDIDFDEPGTPQKRKGQKMGILEGAMEAVSFDEQAGKNDEEEIENLENLGNLENIENFANIANIGNTESTENIENTENTESQNIENTETVENITNTESTENIENITNTENIENTEELIQNPEQEIIPPSDDSGDFDDMTLLSESYEAQEKFRDYIVSELSKKNVDLTVPNNEFKLDISQRTLSMIARSMAKKIAKHVNTIYSQDAKASAQLASIKEQNKKLEQRNKDLEEQNKKLRLLLAESNKNLNSYKPSIFGLYKKVAPDKQ